MKTNWLRHEIMKWKRDVTFILWQARTLMLLLKHPLTPWLARLVAGCAAAYLLSPIQLIPTFIPIVGQMDDLFVVFIGMKLLRKLTPNDILAECEARARRWGSDEHAERQPELLTDKGIRCGLMRGAALCPGMREPTVLSFAARRAEENDRSIDQLALR
jgi:uncharacterized membrane protein YkvA (DUF1232 family)